MSISISEPKEQIVRFDNKEYILRLRSATQQHKTDSKVSLWADCVVSRDKIALINNLPLNQPSCAFRTNKAIMLNTQNVWDYLQIQKRC